MSNGSNGQAVVTRTTVDCRLIRGEERIRQIDEQIAQLQLERETQQRIVDQFARLVCPACAGHGRVRIPSPPGDMDSGSLVECSTCGGTGRAKP